MSAPLLVTTPTKRTFFYLILMTVFSLAGCGGGSSSKPVLSINNPSVLEGDSSETSELVFTLSLNKTADTDLTVDYATADGTATAGGATDDYAARTGILTIPAGSTSVDLIIDINGDDEVESHETLTLEITNIRGPELENTVTSLTGTGTITNDEMVDPKGYFAGTATLGSTEYFDMTALVYDNRVLMFSPTANVLYDITLNNPDSLDYEGTVAVYVDGQIEQVDAVTVSGEVQDTELSGSISGGTGFGVGSFEVAFDSDNNVGATLARIETFGVNQWFGDLYSVDIVIGGFGFNSAGEWGGGNNNVPVCVFTNGATGIPSADTNIFQLSNVVNQSVSCNYVGSGFTGFASVIDVAGTDNGLLFAETNGTYAVFSVMTRNP